ncbi:MAG: 6-phosphofructokinase [Rikenellaceae bacterium]
MKKSIAILTGGGPAPGMNAVVGSVTKIFLKKGYRVIGMHCGYSGIFSKNPRVEEMTDTIAEEIFTRGGSYLKMSRFKPTDKDFEENFNLDFFVSNNIQLLITVGGDDTASTANRISRFLDEKQYHIANIHVPKTIDNDLPLPMGTNTFGFQTAQNAGTSIAKTVMTDAQTSENWFIIAAMGRSAGHLALGIGSASQCPMIIIPEIFNKTEITLEKILKLIVSCIVKRTMIGKNYGAIMISEGVFHALDEDEMINSGITFSYDEHGHPELGKVSKAVIFNTMFEQRAKELGLKVKSRPVEIGYEVRCVDPIAFDLNYCAALGHGAMKLYEAGISGCMVYIDSIGNASPLYLKDLQDKETGKINPRLVNVNSDRIRYIVTEGVDYICEADYEEASKFIPNPEEYDYYKILNW